jgi:CRP-like cAMP-binding protein
MELLRDYISHYIPLEDNEWEAFTRLFETVNYNKGDIVYEASDTPTHIYFILTGIVRSYKLDTNGKDSTWSFHCLTTNSINHRMLMDICVVDYASFIKSEPSDLAFEALQDTTLVKINKNDFETLFKKYQKWDTFSNKVLEDAYITTKDRALSLLTQTAQERLDTLVQYYPYVFKKKVLLEHIASYLGMTRQTLGRLTKNNH